MRRRRKRPRRRWPPRPDCKAGPVPRAVRGAVSREAGEPVEILQVMVPEPGPGEAVVDVQACGVCRTDLHYHRGEWSGDFPFLLGHEAAGVVAEVGEGVDEVAPGDFVILNWRAACGRCRWCRRGRREFCSDSLTASRPMTLADGTALTPAMGIGGLAEAALVAAGQCTKANSAVPPAAAGLLGCGVTTGFGAAAHTGGAGRGDRVAVFGCGGVGCGAVAGAYLAGATVVIAVDIDDRKLEWARGFGATHVVNSARTDPVEAVRRAAGGRGVEVAIDAVGTPETFRQALAVREARGTLVLAGVPAADAVLELPMFEMFDGGGAIKMCWYGDCLPSRDFQTLSDLYLQGRFDLEGFISETIGLDEVGEAFQKMEQGAVLRSVVVF